MNDIDLAVDSFIIKYDTFVLKDCKKAAYNLECRRSAKL